jgi:hypothetical protein
LINYSFKELRSLFLALCLYLQKNIEIWCLTLLLKTGNIVHELITESFTNKKNPINNRTRTTFMSSHLCEFVSPLCSVFFSCTPPFCRFRVCYLDFALSLDSVVFLNNPFTLFLRYSVDYIITHTQNHKNQL